MDLDLELVASELEALSFTYGHLEISIQPATLLSTTHDISLVLKPRGIEHEYEACVSCTLVLRVPVGYPAVSPKIEILQARGMDEGAMSELRAEVQACCDELAGELVLGQAIEVALDYVTSINHPVGPCTICLEGFSGVSKSHSIMANGPKVLCFVKLPCYHCFHSDCFWSWHSWQGRNGTGGNSEMTTCPTCRTPASLKSDLPVMKCVNQPVRENEVSLEVPPQWSSLLSEEDVSRIIRMQNECSKGLQVQRDRGGLVQASVAVTVAQLEARAMSRLQSLAP
jgi:E3 ubiquitin-protein ligase RNF25